MWQHKNCTTDHKIKHTLSYHINEMIKDFHLILYGNHFEILTKEIVISPVLKLFSANSIYSPVVRNYHHLDE